MERSPNAKVVLPALCWAVTRIWEWRQYNFRHNWEVKGKRIRSTGWRYKQIQVSGKNTKGLTRLVRYIPQSPASCRNPGHWRTLGWIVVASRRPPQGMDCHTEINMVLMAAAWHWAGDDEDRRRQTKPRPFTYHNNGAPHPGHHHLCLKYHNSLLTSSPLALTRKLQKIVYQLMLPPLSYFQ